MKKIGQDKALQAATASLISAPFSICWKDINMVFAGCNSKFIAEHQNITSSDDVAGLSNDEFAKKIGWEKAIIPKIKTFDHEVLTTGKTITHEYKFKNPTKYTSLTILQWPIKNPQGEILGIAYSAIDVNKTQQELDLHEAKEHAEQANRSKSEFITVMSHELRTPLHGIMGSAQILRTRNLTAEQLEHVEDIFSSCNLLLSLINDILDLTKLEEGRLEFAKIPLDLKELVDDVAHLSMPLAHEKNLKINVEYDDTTPKYIVSDPRRLRQIISNLTINAIKYTEKGSVTIEVFCNKKNSKKAHLMICIKDTGLGIPKSKLAFVFDRFAQLESAHKSQHYGSGLGLSIVKQLVESMHGKISVKSKLHQGSIFCCEFNFSLQPQNTSAKELTTISTNTIDEHTKNHTKTTKTIAEPTVLLVEDNKINQKVARIMLADLGCKVEIVENGKEALQAVKKKYDIIFMDIGLPDINGYEVTTKILTGKTKNKSTPIIAMTAHAYKHDHEKCIASGMRAVLTKPISYERLKKVLTSLESKSS